MLVVGLLPLGALGAWRLARITDRSRAQVLCLLAYLINPLPYNALAAGSWRGMAAYAVSPWLLRRLALVSGAAPFGPTAGPDPSAFAGPADEHVAAPRRRANGGTGPSDRQADRLPRPDRRLWARRSIRRCRLLVGLIVVGLLFGSAPRRPLGWHGPGPAGRRRRRRGRRRSSTCRGCWPASGSDDPDLTFAGRGAEAAGYRLDRRAALRRRTTGRLAAGVGAVRGRPAAPGHRPGLAPGLGRQGLGRGCRLLGPGRPRACRRGVVPAAPAPRCSSPRPRRHWPSPSVWAWLAFEVDLRGYRFGWRQAALVVATGGPRARHAAVRGRPPSTAAGTCRGRATTGPRGCRRRAVTGGRVPDPVAGRRRGPPGRLVAVARSVGRGRLRHHRGPPRHPQRLDRAGDRRHPARAGRPGDRPGRGHQPAGPPAGADGHPLRGRVRPVGAGAVRRARPPRRPRARKTC